VLSKGGEKVTQESGYTIAPAPNVGTLFV
jgi:hypothetical protein